MPQKQYPSFLETDLPPLNLRTEADKLMDLMSPTAKQDINPSFPTAMKAPISRRHSLSDVPNRDIKTTTSGEFDKNFPLSSATDDLGSPILGSFPPHQPNGKALPSDTGSLGASRSLPKLSINVINLSHSSSFGNGSIEKYLTVITPPISSPQILFAPSPPYLPKNFGTIFDEKSTLDHQNPSDNLSTKQSEELGSSSYSLSRKAFMVTEKLGDGLTKSSWSTTSLPENPSPPASLPRTKMSFSAPPSVSSSPISGVESLTLSSKTTASKNAVRFL